MCSLSNENIDVTVTSTGKFCIYDKSRDERWESKNVGWLTLFDENEIKLDLESCMEKNIDVTDNILKVIFTNSNSDKREVKFRLSIEIKLLESEVEITIADLDTEYEFISLEYPAHFINVSTGSENCYTVIPLKQGVIIPTRLDTGFMRYMHNTWHAICDVERVMQFDSGALNMPWFGAHKNDSDIFCWIKTPADCSLHIIGNAVVSAQGDVKSCRWGKEPGERISSLAPVWLSSFGRLGYKRIMRVRILSGGYVGMAQEYRKIAIETGRHVSLKDKISKNKNNEKMLGAPDIKIYIYTNRLNNPYFRSLSEPVLDGYRRIHTTFEQASRICEELKSLGITKSLILLGGWNRAGYDREHIDMWPPAEDAGGVAGLARLSETAAKNGFVFALHDNYQDFYTDSPSYDESCIVQQKDGTRLLGGIWDGGLCRMICSSQVFGYVKNNIDHVKNETKTDSYYLDTTTSASLHECYDENHMATRAQDRESKIKLLKYLVDEGFVVGAEAGIDWAIPYVTYFEGIPGDSSGFNAGIESAFFGISAPLFNIVYHDAVICYWQHGQPYGREDHVNHVLHDIINAQPSSWSIVYDQWEDLKPLILQTYELLSELHAKTAHFAMVEHKFLSDDFALQKAVYENGIEMVVNYSIQSYIYQDIKIPPKGFMIKMDDTVKLGRLSRDILI